MTCVTLSTADRERLVKLCGMLGSDHDGERASAGLLASRLVQGRGLTWADVIASGPQAPPPPPPPRPGASCPPSRANEMHLVLAHFGMLTEWERSFVRSVARQQRWSPKQEARFAEVLSKVQMRSRRA